MTPTLRYTPFGPEETREFSITLSPVPNTEWNMTEYIVNRRCGSAFDAWVQMGAPEELIEEELACLKAYAGPGIHKTSLLSTDHSLNVHLVLEQLEIRLIILSKK